MKPPSINRWQPNQKPRMLWLPWSMIGLLMIGMLFVRGISGAIYTLFASVALWLAIDHFLSIFKPLRDRPTWYFRSSSPHMSRTSLLTVTVLLIACVTGFATRALAINTLRNEAGVVLLFMIPMVLLTKWRDTGKWS